MTKASARPQASVVVCCHNSVSRLGPTLDHLAVQRMREGEWFEVVVVDNASSDGTGTFAANRWSRIGGATPLRVVHEETPGQSFARRRGVAEASGEIIVFCDDDNRLDVDYVQTCVDVLASDAAVGAVGGRSEAETDAAAGPPTWFHDVATGYAVGRQASADGDVTERGYLWGAGLAVRKASIDRLYSRADLLLSGRSGRRRTSGDDSELCALIIAQGYRLQYSEKLRFRHFVPQERLDQAYWDDLQAGFVNAAPVLTAYRRLLILARADALSSVDALRSVYRKVLGKLERSYPDAGPMANRARCLSIIFRVRRNLLRVGPVSRLTTAMTD